MANYSFDAVIFDLDGVITKTALIHAASWKQAFDEYLLLREKRDGEKFQEFTHENDYLPYVDGRPRYQGVKAFLDSRGISLEFGDPQDLPDKETICGLGNKKNVKFNEILEKQGIEVYPTSVQLIKDLKAAGIHIGLASSSKNCLKIIQAAGIEDLFETRVDGVVSAELNLKGKPEGDIFVTASRNIGVCPSRAVVVEDAVTGVAAGRNGAFGMVIGVSREGKVNELFKNGADIVVKDLGQININSIENWFKRFPRKLYQSWDKPLVSSDKNINPYYLLSAKQVLFSKPKLVFFLDYDGTLTPIVSRPEDAKILPSMRNIVIELSKKFTVAIVSGRMRQDVENLVGIDNIFYAGSHGFDIKGPNLSLIQPEAEKTIELINKIINEFKQELGAINGLKIEEKKYSVAVHYRLVDEEKYFTKIRDCVKEKIEKYSQLRFMHGKKVFEILPAIDWDKGKAVRWIMNALGVNWDDASIIYIGDDTTDEDAFRMVKGRGLGILVADSPKLSSADFLLDSPNQVEQFFKQVIDQK